MDTHREDLRPPPGQEIEFRDKPRAAAVTHEIGQPLLHKDAESLLRKEGASMKG